MFKLEVSGIQFQATPGWFQLAVGVSMFIGIWLLITAVFLAPRELEVTGADDAAGRRAEAGALVCAGTALVLLVTLVIIPTIRDYII